MANSISGSYPLSDTGAGSVPNNGVGSCSDCSTRIKNCFKNAKDNLVAGVQHVGEFLDHAVGSAENVQSICKFGKSTIGFIKYALKTHSEGFNNLREDLDVADGVLDFVDFFRDASDYAAMKPDKQDNNVRKHFWNHKGISTSKILSRAFGTTSRVLGVYKYVLELGLVNLGHVSASLNTIPLFNVILQFSPLRVVKDSLSIISASFGLVDQSKALHKHRKWKNGSEGKIAELKLEKWKVKESLLEFLALNSDEARAAELEKLFPQNAPNAEDYLASLRNKYLSARFSLARLGVVPRLRGDDQVPKIENNPTMFAREIKWGILRDRYETTDVDVNRGACQAKIKNNVQKFTKNWVEQVKNWMGIAFNIVKIAAMVLGLAGIFVAASISGSLPYIVAVSAAWFITSAIGMGRMYYNFKHQNT